jgi:hypothetical protein
MLVEGKYKQTSALLGLEGTEDEDEAETDGERRRGT